LVASLTLLLTRCALVLQATCAALSKGICDLTSVTRAYDGLPPGEGSFLLCTFWLADDLVLLGEREDALDIFERLLSLRNDVGLLSEQYDPRARRLLGNFPQAFSHVALINTAYQLTPDEPAPARGD
jgi:hypothetical protein